MGNPVVVNFGGGVNSTALLVGMAERKERPDAILFADTGGEWPETYDHVSAVDKWSRETFGVPVTRLTRPFGPRIKVHWDSLYNECVGAQTLPSLAFGFKGCSRNWKQHPMDHWLNAWEPAIEAWKEGRKVTRLIGIDAGEPSRSQALCDAEHKKWEFRRPLIDWGWAREECVSAIARAGLPVPRKSACWFCPATKKHEVRRMAREAPQKLALAIAMERNFRAGPHYRSDGVQGLGRNWSWEEIAAADESQLDMFRNPPPLACLCFDGEREGDA